MFWTYVTLLAAIAWLVLFLLPWQPWRTREVLDSDYTSEGQDLSQLTVIIPARNEESVIETTLAGLKTQGPGLNIILVDDCSDDSTVERARAMKIPGLTILNGVDTPKGWSGKLWALAQGMGHANTPYILLLDADIFLMPGIVYALLKKMEDTGADFVSLMASLRMVNFWERLLMPPFIYFFKLIYPFSLSNSPSSRVGAAAGGCILTKKYIIEEIGGFESLKGELIDDCSLARRVKSYGYKTWTGLTHSVISLREYDLSSIWNMVARTAFTQLNYSSLMLILVSISMITMFVVPAMGLFIPVGQGQLFSVAAMVIMSATYIPTLRFYGLSAAWAITLPLSSSFYLAMTWSSAIRFWMGKGASWKGRRYTNR